MSQYKTTTKLFLRLKVNEIGTRSYHALGAHIFLRWKAKKKNQGTQVVSTSWHVPLHGTSNDASFF